MEDKITSILKFETSKSKPFMKLPDLLIKSLEVSITDDNISEQMELTNQFEECVIRLHNEKIIRINADLTVGLEEYISDILNQRRLSALEEMQEELQKCIEEEDYEGAAEYRDMINEYNS